MTDQSKILTLEQVAFIRAAYQFAADSDDISQAAKVCDSHGVLQAQLAEAQDDIQALAETLQALPSKIDSVGNGYCTLCGGHRFFNTLGNDVGKCQNPSCWSHQRRQALDRPGVRRALEGESNQSDA